MTTRTHRRRLARVAAFAPAFVIGGMLLGSAPASAAPLDTAPLDPDLTATGLTSFGAAAYAETGSYGLGTSLTVRVTDTRADSRCAYLDAKFVVSGGPDGSWRKEVCGAGTTEQAWHVVTPWGWGRVDRVEVKVCRDQGFGADPCSDVVALAP